LCGGIKTVKHNVKTTLRLAYQAIKMYKSHAHEQNTSSKTHPIGCNYQVHDSRVSYLFKLVRIELNEAVARKDVRFKPELSPESL